MTENDIQPTGPPKIKRSRSLIWGVVGAVVSLLLYLGLSTGINIYTLNNNNSSQQRIEQAAIQKAIEANNKKFCDIIVTVNKSATGASHSNHKENSYSLRLISDFKQLDKEYKCGS